MKINIIFGLTLIALSLSHNALGKEIQLTCHSLGQKGINEIVFNIDLKEKKIKLAGLSEDLKVIIFNEDFIIGFLGGNDNFNKTYYSINRKSGFLKSSECYIKDEKTCLLRILTSFRPQQYKKCEVIKDSLF
ncbi:MAG: hypothetical protein IH886_04415 [Nitrospinae bacterium]|nr:hypothetical protein [Nitrospinota bacterium]